MFMFCSKLSERIRSFEKPEGAIVSLRLFDWGGSSLERLLFHKIKHDEPIKIKNSIHSCHLASLVSFIITLRPEGWTVFFQFPCVDCRLSCLGYESR